MNLLMTDIVNGNVAELILIVAFFIVKSDVFPSLAPLRLED